MTDVESCPGNDVEVSIDDGVTGKEVCGRVVDPQTYRREDVWPTLLYNDEVKSALCAILRKIEDYFLQSLRTKSTTTVRS